MVNVLCAKKILPKNGRAPCLWSADSVFLDDAVERDECVMTETGIIYHGSYDDVAERHWNYGQVRSQQLAHQEFRHGRNGLICFDFHTQVWTKICFKATTAI